ncbi:DUF1691-domain-containing protein [Hypoxylon trugodes]|uniref:DUF1691-domain-containing protein n=1 Tax=Hypoxylon trugodes TaxID=326681 RepID=UPI00218EA61B|nr:DUF1691-domain-containing protein [Hypoxylon trugodes]KAI1391781.1 DUF1691-domain-containing protein [Hypoxylon trugodes]
MAPDHRTLHPKASEETLVSLLQLDPSPIDNASIYDKELPPLPEDDASQTSSRTLKSTSTSSTSTSTLGLSGSGRGPIFYLSRIQRYSSYTFSFFAGLHIANTSIFPLVYQSVPYSEPFLLMARELYQTRFTEPLLITLPVVAHITSGVAIRLLRRRQNLTRYGGATPGVWPVNHPNASSFSYKHIWPPLSYISASGYLFVGLLASHVGMNRVLPLVVDGDSSNIGLQFVSHGFARHPLPPWIAYSLLLSVGVGHMVWGWAKWFNLTPPANWKKTTIDKRLRRSRRRAWWGVQGVAVTVAALWAAGGLGIVARAGPVEGWLATVYDNIYSAAGH